MLLEEIVEGVFEPTREEIACFAKYMKVNLTREAHIEAILIEGIKARLPRNWKPCQSPSGDIFYFNTITKTSTWEHPLDKHYRQLIERIQTGVVVNRHCLYTISDELSLSDEPAAASVPSCLSSSDVSEASVSSYSRELVELRESSVDLTRQVDNLRLRIQALKEELQRD